MARPKIVINDAAVYVYAGLAEVTNKVPNYFLIEYKIILIIKL